jgi:hypothetical protein
VIRFRHRILFVTGKGGVGKSSVTAALGLQAARAGLRTIICEPSGATRMPELFGVPSRGYELTRLTENLHCIAITPEQAMEDYVVQQIKVRRLYRMVFRNRVVGPFVDGVPGLHDAVQLGKVFDLEREEAGDRKAWDLVLVDAPATGHGLTLLMAARTMMDLTRAGPLYEGNKLVDARIADPAVTGIVLVALPEEMPVAETIDLYGRLGPRRGQVQLCVLNQIHDRPFPGDIPWPTARAALADADGPALAEAVALTDAWVARITRQDEAAARLAAALPCPHATLPRRPEREMTPDTLRALGAGLLGPLVEEAGA